MAEGASDGGDADDGRRATGERRVKKQKRRRRRRWKRGEGEGAVLLGGREPVTLAGSARHLGCRRRRRRDKYTGLGPTAASSNMPKLARLARRRMRLD